MLFLTIFWAVRECQRVVKPEDVNQIPLSLGKIFYSGLLI
jgi:hypothetical protein